jgi:hypothetical protein
MEMGLVGRGSGRAAAPELPARYTKEAFRSSLTGTGAFFKTNPALKYRASFVRSPRDESARPPVVPGMWEGVLRQKQLSLPCGSAQTVGGRSSSLTR